MADKKISQLTTGNAAQAGDDFVVARGGVNYRISGTNVAAAATSVGTLTDLTVTNPIAGSVTGNAATATRLATARTINGVAFDGTANITVTATAAAGTLTGTTLAAGVTGSSLTSVGTLTSGAIGAGFTAIPNSALANSTVTVNGTAIALGASGTVTAAAGTLTGNTLASGVTASSLTSVGTLGSLTVTNAITAPQLTSPSSMILNSTGNNAVQLWTGGSARLVLGGSGNITAQTPLLFSGDNTHDIGAVGATRPRTIYAGTSVVAPTVTVSSDLTVDSSSNGVVSTGTFRNPNNGTSAISRVRFGNDTSANAFTIDVLSSTNTAGGDLVRLWNQTTPGGLSLGTNGAERVRLTPTGRINLNPGSGNNAYIECAAGTNTAGTNSALYGQDTSNFAYCWNRASAPLIFGTSGVERVRLDAAGNVGIRTMSPSYQLHSSNPSSGDQNMFMFGIDALSNGVFADWIASTFNVRFRIANLPTTASAANAFLDSGDQNRLYRSTSSIRYKTDVESIETQYADAVLGLRPVWYRSIAGEDKRDWSWYGLIAEEVAAVEPRLVHWTYLEEDYDVTTDESGVIHKTPKPDAQMVPDGVQYDRLPVLLLDVIKRQQARLDQMEARLAALEA